MEHFVKATSDPDDKHTDGLTAYHHYVLSSVLPEAEQEFLCMQKKNKALEKENEAFKKKVRFLMTEAEQIRAERQRTQKLMKNGEQQRSQLLLCRNELSLLRKKMSIQETELRRERRQSRSLREELETLKKELQAAKQGGVSQRAETLRLKEQLEQVVRDRDGLSDSLLRCKHECSELRDKISSQKSSVNQKESRCREQRKQIHVLTLERQKLEKERSLVESGAEEQRRELRRRGEELHAQREKLKESRRCHAVGDQIGKRILIVPQRSHAVRRARAEAPLQKLQKLESVQKELLAKTEELRRTQRLCEELKDKLTKVAGRFQQCQATVREQRDKLKALTAERNMYRSLTESLGTESADVRHNRGDRQRNKRSKTTRGS